MAKSGPVTQLDKYKFRKRRKNGGLPLTNEAKQRFMSRRREEKKITKKNGQQSQASKLGRRSKKKGYEGEREVVNLLRKYGIKAERVPLSGALKSQKYSCDVALGNGKRIEVKRRKSGMKTIQKWLEEDKYSNYVFFREDGDTDGWIVIMPYMEFIELMQGGS